MNQHVNRRPIRVATFALGLAGVLAAPAAAWAHAEFWERDSVPADSEESLVLNVPEEKGPAVHNAKIVVEIPGGFRVLGCDPKPEWSCTQSESGGKSILTWTRTAGTDPNGLFRFRVRTPAKPGRYPFEVNQFYADGDSAHWDGPPGSDAPAPVLRVG